MTDIELKPSQISAPGTGLRKLEGLVIASLLVAGLYCPTSGNGIPSKVFIGIDYAVCATLLLLLMLKRKDLPSAAARLSLLAIIPLLVVFTVTFGLRTYSFGELASLAVLALLLMLNLRQVAFPPRLYHLFSAVNVFNIVLGIAVFAGSSVVGRFLTKYYAQFDDELVPFMLLVRKPVLTFATHSIAGFFFYLFFYANFQTYRIRGRKFFLVMALCYLLLTAGLLSVTGLLLAVLGSVQVLVYFWRRLPYPRLALAGSLTVLGILASFRYPDPAVKEWNEVSQAGRAILSSPENGFLGRLRPGGTMYPAMQYLKEHPFSPLGVSRRETLLVADTGLIDYMLRGSVFLVFWAYGGLFFFLRRSLLARWDLYFMFCAILAFELGFSVLGYLRMLFLLPFFVIYLNGLRQSEAGLEA